MKSTNIIFVHGLFGWGPGELGGIPYWGKALEQFGPPFATHEVKCGPISSFHDRACEVFAQIKGTPVDYGEEHSRVEGHERFVPALDFTGKGRVPGWSEANPVILVGHSAGAQTCMQLQQLLEQDFWRIGTNGRWVEAIVSISGVIDGSLLPYHFACDPQSGLLRNPSAALIQRGFTFVRTILRIVPGSGAGDRPIDPYLGQWLGAEREVTDTSLRNFLNGEDNLAFDLTLQGCQKANRKFRSNPDTYYFSIVTSKRVGLPFGGGGINPALIVAEEYQRTWNPFRNTARPPVEGWDTGDLVIDKWRENDGAVSTIAQRYPSTAPHHPPGVEGIGRGAGATRTGVWYYERVEAIVGRKFDHLDIVVGCQCNPADFSVEALQPTVYRKLYDLLRDPGAYRAAPAPGVRP